jgi:hypothetical protein
VIAYLVDGQVIDVVRIRYGGQLLRPETWQTSPFDCRVPPVKRGRVQYLSLWSQRYPDLASSRPVVQKLRRPKGASTMPLYETITFKSGKGVAMRLPEAFGIAPGVRMAIEQSGNLLWSARS